MIKPQRPPQYRGGVVTWRAAAQSTGRPPRARGGGTGPVGRDDILGQLSRVVDQVIAGRGHLLLLTGEAGIGKTTLLAEAACYAEDRGARVAWGWGWPGEGAPGYWPWVQVMRALGLDTPLSATAGSLDVEAAPASARFQLFDEVTSLLLAESRMQPLVVLLDDLQWADQPSQLLLDFLARRLPAGAAAVVSATATSIRCRARHSPLSAARTTVLPLTGLTVEAVTELIGGVVGEQRAGTSPPTCIGVPAVTRSSRSRCHGR